MNCNTNIFSECLLLNFDLAKVKSYDGNSGFTISSLYNWSDSISTNITINDFGLTEYDVARSSSLTSSTIFNTIDKTFKLYRIGENDAIGNTSYNNYSIVPLFDSTTGLYLKLDGGYLQNFFKVYGHDYELLPTRFNKGFTFETWLKLDNNSFTGITSNNDGIFLYLGTRAENKFNNIFSGNTGYTTSNDLSLGFGDNINNVESGLSGNVLSFKFNNDRTMSVRYIDELGYLKQHDVSKVISNTGWTMVTISFNPYEFIPNFINVQDCYPSRLGDLNIYINGRPYTKIVNFTEFWFKELKGVDAEKQVGVPYNISWGGGSFGLKHSWNYNPYFKINPNNLITVADNGSFETNINGIVSSYSLSADTNTFLSGGTTSLAIYNDNSGVTINDSALLKLDQVITLSENKIYDFSCYVTNNNNLFNSSGNDIKIILSGLTSNITGVTILNEFTYLTNTIVDTNWIKLNFKIKTNSNWLYNNLLNIQPTIAFITSDLNTVNQYFKINVDEFSCYKYDYIKNEYKQNLLNNDLIIEQNFNGSFKGGIQKLRLHGCNLTFDKVLHNFRIDNKIYNIPETFGGRLIYY